MFFSVCETFNHYFYTFSFSRELLEQIREFEEREFSGAKKKDFIPKKLEPMNDTGLTQLLNMVKYLLIVILYVHT